MCNFTLPAEAFAAGETTNMAQVIQVEIKTGTTHTLTWLDAALKLKADTALVCNGYPLPWTVVHAYNNTPREMIGIHSGWHVGGLRSPSAVGAEAVVRK
jgi:hypothetical protein